MTKSFSSIAALSLVLSIIPAGARANVASVLQDGAGVNTDAKQTTPEQAAGNAGAVLDGGKMTGPTAPAVAGNDGLKDAPAMTEAAKHQKDVAVPDVSLRDMHNTTNNVASGAIATRTVLIPMATGAAFGVAGAMLFGWPGAFLAIPGIWVGVAINIDLITTEVRRGDYYNWYNN